MQQPKRAGSLNYRSGNFSRLATLVAIKQPSEFERRRVMMLNKTVHQIYKEQTGHTDWLSAGEDEHALSLYVEGPTRLYIAWLEQCAAEEHGVAALQTTNSSSHKMPSECIACPIMGVCNNQKYNSDMCKLVFVYLARHFGH